MKSIIDTVRWHFHRDGKLFLLFCALSGGPSETERIQDAETEAITEAVPYGSWRAWVTNKGGL